MILSDIEINFENGEIIRISNDAILSLSFHTAGTQYSFSDEITRVDTEVDKLDLLVSQRDISHFSYVAGCIDKNDDAASRSLKAIDLLRHRRDITSFTYETNRYHVKWYEKPTPDNYAFWAFSMAYCNGFQDPTEVSNRDTMRIRIDATRREPPYRIGLVDGNKLYVAECECSNTYTLKADLPAGINYRGRFVIAVCGMRELEPVTFGEPSAIQIWYRPVEKQDGNRVILPPVECSSFICPRYKRGVFIHPKNSDNMEHTDIINMDSPLLVFEPAMYQRSLSNQCIDKCVDDITRNIDDEILSTMTKSSQPNQKVMR